MKPSQVAFSEVGVIRFRNLESDSLTRLNRGADKIELV